MHPTEAALGQPLDPRLDPVAPTALAITAGDLPASGEEAAREHDWPATLFIFLGHLTSWGLGLAAVGTLLMMMLAENGWPREPLGVAAGLALAAALAAGSFLQRHLAESVKNFTRWGWYGAMGELAFATLAKVNVLVGDPAGEGVGAVFGIAIDLLWMKYFWERRADYDVDLEL
jgi:hypothetical protein